MKWLKSTTQKSYRFNGKTIPQAVTEDNVFLSLTESEWLEWKKHKVFKSLYENGAIFVTDKEPTSPTKQLSNVTKKNAELVLENTQLKKQLEELQSSSNDNSEVATLQAALEKQKADDLAEIKELQRAKDAEIEALKAQLEKLQSETSEE